MGLYKSAKSQLVRVDRNLDLHPWSCLKSSVLGILGHTIFSEKIMRGVPATGWFTGTDAGSGCMGAGTTCGVGGSWCTGAKTGSGCNAVAVGGGGGSPVDRGGVGANSNDEEAASKASF